MRIRSSTALNGFKGRGWLHRLRRSSHQPNGETEGVVQGVCDGQHQLEGLDGDPDTAMGLGRQTGGAGVPREVATHNYAQAKEGGAGTMTARPGTVAMNTRPNGLLGTTASFPLRFPHLCPQLVSLTYPRKKKS